MSNLENNDYLLKDFSLDLENIDPYKDLDEDIKEAAICLMNIGSRFHNPKRSFSNQELNELIPLMKDAVDCVNNISKIKSKEISTNFILNHKAVYADLVASLTQKEIKSINVVEKKLRTINADIISFINNNLIYIETNKKEFINLPGYNIFKNYLEIELSHQMALLATNQLIIKHNLKIITKTTSVTVNETILNIIYSIVNNYEILINKEKKIINNMLGFLKNEF